MPRCQETRGAYQCAHEEGHAGNHSPGAPACPVPGCEQIRKMNQMMCRAHWFRVPKDLRDRIWRLVRLMGSEAGMSDYKDARGQAIAAAANWVPAKTRAAANRGFAEKRLVSKAKVCNFHGVNVPAGGKCALCEAS